MSPLRGFEDAGAAMLCYQYVAPLVLVRHVRTKRQLREAGSIAPVLLGLVQGRVGP
ncbi:MAG: hypothetical protein RLZZ396_2117, partial [Planctomycetota bacterium]